MQTIESVRKDNFMRVIYVGLCSLTLLTSYFVAQNLMSKIYDDLGFGSLGQVCIFTVYVSICITSLVFPHFIKKISLKTGLILGCSSYTLFILGGVLLTYCERSHYNTGYCSFSFIYTYNVVGSFGVGIGGSFFWLSQGIYVNTCADEEARGSFNGIFFALIQASQILSSVIATLVLHFADQFTFYSILLAIAILSLLMFSFMKSPLKYPSAIEEEGIQDVSLRDSLKSIFKTIAKKENYYMFAVMTYSGFGLGFYITYLGTATSLALRDPKDEKGAAFVFLILAFGEVLAGLVMARLADKFDKVRVLGFCTVFHEAALLCTFFAVYTNSFGLAIMAGGLWGFGDNSLFTMTNVVIGSRFNASSEMFSCYSIFQAIGTLVASILSILLSAEYKEYFFLTIVGLLLVTQVMFFGLQSKKSEGDKGSFLDAKGRINYESVITM